VAAITLRVVAVATTVEAGVAGAIRAVAAEAIANTFSVSDHLKGGLQWPPFLLVVCDPLTSALKGRGFSRAETVPLSRVCHPEGARGRSPKRPTKRDWGICFLLMSLQKRHFLAAFLCALRPIELWRLNITLGRRSL
jgi:hypothetical protein